MQGRLRLEAWIFIPDRTQNVLAARRPADISGLARVRSRAPPLIALVGLLGMVLGEQAVSAVRHHFTPIPTSLQQVADGAQASYGPGTNEHGKQRCRSERGLSDICN